ncbi:thioredoxin-related transmembrane protein 1 isoform X2 [Lycorma delicatula]|uniref:thioredoxin-related transmembrane protein 1 isoform X2 n=1 Tax=Lycorma delicatula TaxID=130591 RepID=UPI003F515995
MAIRVWKCLWLLTFSIIFLKFCLVLGKSQLYQLNEDNWDLMLTGEWMVEFYAPWCPACKALQPLWEDYSSWSKELGISVGQVDVTTSPGLSGRFMVTALPTIFHVCDGEFRQYRGPRDKESFMSFVEERKWKASEAIPSWKSPASLQMSIVAYFFKLSQLLRAVHTRLMEEYGLPTWGSYIIFAVATIILGALLGLLLVCIIDLIYPPKVVASMNVDVSKEKADSGEESDDDWGDEEIVDENSGDQKKFESEVEEEETAKPADDLEEETEDSAEQNNPVRKRKARKAD